MTGCANSGATLALIVRTHMPLPHLKKLKIGAVILVVGTLPLLLYVALGPKDGNPIGLGILMWLSWLIGGVLVVLGAGGAVIAHFQNKGDL